MVAAPAASVAPRDPGASLPPAPAYEMPGVELFASGEYRGKPWTAADVEEVAANVRRLGPSGLKLFTPPVVIGHEEPDEFPDRTDVPAAGVVDPGSIRAVPDPDHPGEEILVGDVVNIPRGVAEQIARGEFFRCSVELYDQFTDDFGRDHGKVLRRLALLGAEPSQVKRTKSLPTPRPMAAVKKFAERAVRLRVVRNDNRTLCYAETTDMDRTSMIAAIQAAMPGLAQATLDALSDDQLADLAKNIPAGGAATAPEAPPTGGVTAAGEGGGAEPTREQMVQGIAAKGGQDPDTLSKMDDSSLKSLYSSVTGPGGASPMADKVPVTRCSEGAGGKGGGSGDPADPAVRAALGRLAETVAFAERQAARLGEAGRRLKDQKIAAFRDDMVRTGRIKPGEFDRETAPLLRLLDDTHPLHRFSEDGGRTTRSGTAFERKMAEIRAGRPANSAVHFGERLDGPGPDGPSAKELAVARARRFAGVQAAALRSAGKTPEQFVAKFSELYDKDPAAAARIIPAEYAA